MNGIPNRMIDLISVRRPDAVAELRGAPGYPNLRGNLKLYQTSLGVLVWAEAFGLPCERGACRHPVFGMHIHEGGQCTGSEEDPFADAKAHYNPEQCPHPAHAGDLPPLFCCYGYGLNVCMTDRFQVREVIGRAAIIHRMPDDFMTQPSGNSGQKIACGVIMGTKQK